MDHHNDEEVEALRSLGPGDETLEGELRAILRAERTEGSEWKARATLGLLASIARSLARIESQMGQVGGY